MIDAHCHLYGLSDIETEVQRFEKAGGRAIICCGAGLETSRRAVEMASKHPIVYATVGIHPEEDQRSKIKDQNLVESLKTLAANSKVIGIGECGLDFYEKTGTEEKRWQEELLRFNIELAKETKLPLVVHCRAAFEEVYNLVKEAGVAGQMHCWTGSKEWMRKFVELGWDISFGGIVTFKSSGELREVARVVPEERLLVETDAPWLAPEPVRGSQNTPTNVKYVIDCLAQVRGTSSEKVEELTETNARRLFGL